MRSKAHFDAPYLLLTVFILQVSAGVFDNQEPESH